MSTTGILRPDEVVFYHPLDNFDESTQSQTWTGTGSFVAGKVPDAAPLGLSAVTGDAFAFGNGAEFASQGDSDKGTAVAKLGTDKMIVGWADNNGNGGVRVASLLGTTITYGPSVQHGGLWEASICALTSTTFLFLSCTAGSTNASLWVGQVSGTSVTLGNVTECNDMGGNPERKLVRAIDSSRAVVAWLSETGTHPLKIKVRVATVSGLGATLGPTHISDFQTYFNRDHFDFSLIDSDRLLCCYADLNDGQHGKGRIVTVSGTDITWGPAHKFAAEWVYREISCAALTSSSVVVAWNGPGGSHRGFTCAGTVSGTDITWGPKLMFTDPVRELAYTGYVEVMRLDDTHAAFSFEATQAPTGGQVVRGTVSGLDIAFGAETSWSSVFSPSAYPGTATVDPSRIMVVYNGTGNPAPDDGGVGKVAALGMEAEMTAPTPGAYPSAIGATRLAAAVWAKNLTKGSSIVTLNRGYGIEMTETEIALWADFCLKPQGCGIWGTYVADPDCMGTMNDGDDHLLVLDFEHTSGGNWNLRTSIDGAAWVDHGQQDSGSQAVATADTAPRLEIADGESGQWIDELIVWAGDKAVFERFTSEELANLHDLAETFGEGMGEYEQNYGAPICWQATAKLPDGTVWRDSGSGPCPPVVRVPRGASGILVTDNGRQVSPRIVEG